jgi:Kef-type K+ transport system membrane component KefB
MPEIADIAQTVEFRLLMLAFLVLAGPILAERLRLPGLVGLVFLGMLFGPFVFGWVLPSGLVAVVGAIGLLYLMFLAGLELDINTFLANRTASITFGLLTFAIPFGLSLAVGLWALDYTGAAAALVGAMWASHTLVAYTEVKAAGLEQNRAVGAAVSATVITDVLALVILGFAVSAGSEAGSPSEADIAIVPVGIGVFLLAGFCLWVLPRLTSWFFTHVGLSRLQRFVWTLGVMALGAFVSLLGGMEGLVGAFLAGIGINRQVPAHGQLMERIEFFGAALFVPAFLITVGMSIDPAALTEPSTIALALLFTAVVLVGKVLAATVAGLIFGFTWPEIGMMSALTLGQAAATLAIAQVGVSNGIFGQDVLNAAVLTVVITVLITSFATRAFARRLEPAPRDSSEIGRQVLVRVPSSGGELDGVLDVGVAIAHKENGLLTPFIVCDDGGCGDMTAALEKVVEGAIERGQDSEGVTRIAESPVEGALNLATESEATLLLLPWSGPRFPGSLFFGDSIDEIGGRSPVPTVAARIVDSDWNRVLYFQGLSKDWTVREEDAATALDIAQRVAAQKGIELVIFATDSDELPSIGEGAVNTYSGRGSRGLDAIASGDLVVVPVQVAQDALGLGAVRLTRQLRHSSLLIVAGPGRLQISTRADSDRVVGGGAFNRRSRESLGEVWQAPH